MVCSAHTSTAKTSLFTGIIHSWHKFDKQNPWFTPSLNCCAVLSMLFKTLNKRVTKGSLFGHQRWRLHPFIDFSSWLWFVVNNFIRTFHVFRLMLEIVFPFSSWPPKKTRLFAFSSTVNHFRAVLRFLKIALWLS